MDPDNPPEVVDPDIVLGPAGFGYCIVSSLAAAVVVCYTEC